MPQTYEPIATTTLGSAANSITFSSIPSTYTDLRLVIVYTATTGQPTSLRFNSDTGTNYSGTYLVGQGASVSSGRASNQTAMPVEDIEGATSTPYLVEIDVFSYAGSTNKTALISVAGDRNGAGEILKYVGLWRSTSAINTLEFKVTNASFNLLTGTTATLYGIKNA
jgi:hypothetical protein